MNKRLDKAAMVIDDENIDFKEDFLAQEMYSLRDDGVDEMYSSMNSDTRGDVRTSHLQKPDSHINIKVEFGEGEGKVQIDKIAERVEAYKPKEKVTYKKIQEYIEKKYVLRYILPI